MMYQYYNWMRVTLKTEAKSIDDAFDKFQNGEIVDEEIHYDSIESEPDRDRIEEVA